MVSVNSNSNDKSDSSLERQAVLGSAAAATYVGLASSTLAKLRCRGGSPTFLRLGRKIVYLRADLDSWLATRRARNTSEADRLPRRLIDEPSAA
jgi:hypothetical protein